MFSVWCIIVVILGNLLRRMDTFSLEDEDCNELFITQTLSVEKKADGTDGDVIQKKVS